MSKTFCVLPFYGKELPDNIHCCLMKRNSDINDVRNKMLNSERHDACEKCWNLEDLGLPSDRIGKNQMLDYHWNRDIKYIEQDCREGKFSDLCYKIDTSFHCNGGCVTCGPGVSSFWAKLTGTEHDQSVAIDFIDQHVNYKNAISINFRGGEPLLSKTNFLILEKLLENNNNSCFIQITTNGSIRLNKKQISLLKQFKNLNFNLSIDATEKAFEYIRYPLKWNDILDNLQTYRTITDIISVSCTTSNISILYYDRLEKWFHDNYLNYNYSPVYNPKWFRPEALPLDVKQNILQKNSNETVHKFLSSHCKNDNVDFEKMKQQIAWQDQLKGIHIRDYLPELHQLVGFEH